MSRRRALALAAALAVVATSCTAGGTTSPRPAGGPTSSTTAGQPPSTGPDGPDDAAEPGADPPVPAVDLLAWTSCDGGFECATTDAPLDYAEPDGPTIELGIVRRPASGDRVGSLFVNPGGPGASAIEFVEALPLGQDLTEHFDIVGMDSRGLGRSTPLECNAHLVAMYDADPTMEDQRDVDAYLRDSQAYVDECEADRPDLLPHLGTEDVVRDMDLVRAAMGDDQLSYLGFSYGTSIGQTYARLFPTHVRAMVIDGVVDLSVDALTAATQQAAGFETALDAFVEDCDERSCLGDSARDAIRRVIAASEAGTIAPAERPITPGVVNLALGQALYAKVLWPGLASALGDALDDDGDGLLQLADQYLRRRPDGSYGHDFEVYFGTGCLDGDYPRDPQAVLAAAKEAGKDSPTFGEAIVNDYVRCALWPVPSQPLVPVPADLEGLVPILVISTTRDPATPYENGVRAADQIPGAILITNDGDGHTAFTGGKRCITEPVTRYLVDLEVPDGDLTCD